MKILLLLTCLVTLALGREKEEVSVSAETSESLSSSEESITHIKQKLQKVKHEEQQQRQQERQDKVLPFVVPVPQAMVYETMPYPVLAPNFLPVAQPPVVPAVVPVLQPEIMENLKAQETAIPKRKPMPFLPSPTPLPDIGPQIPNQPLLVPQLQPAVHQVPQVILQPFPQVAPLVPAQPQLLSVEPTVPRAPQHVQPTQGLQLYRALQPVTALHAPATQPLAQDYAHVIV